MYILNLFDDHSIYLKKRRKNTLLYYDIVSSKVMIVRWYIYYSEIIWKQSMKAYFVLIKSIALKVST